MFIPDETGRIPFSWAIPPGASPVNQNAVVDGSFTIAFADGQPFQGDLCVPKLVELTAKVTSFLEGLRTVIQNQP